MNIAPISFQGKKYYQPSLPLKLSAEDEKKVIEYTEKAEAAWAKFNKTKSWQMEERYARQVHNNLDKAIEITSTRGDFFEIQRPNKNSINSQELLGRKWMFSNMRKGQKPAPSVEEIINLKPNSEIAKALKKFVLAVRKLG